MTTTLKMKLNTTRKASIPRSAVKQSHRLREAPETTLKEQTLLQLKKLFKGCTEGYIVTIPSFDGNKPVAGKKFRHDQIEEAARYILKNNVQYLKPVLMGDRVVAKGYAVGGIKDVTEIKAIGFDIDTAEKSSKYLSRDTVEALLGKLDCKPSMVIETRKGAGLHVYWTLSDATKISSDNRDSIKSIVKRFNQFICSKIEGTDAAGNLDRVLRCAGTKREDGSMVKVIFSSRKKYTLDEIAGFAESVPEEPKKEYQPKGDAGNSWKDRIEKRLTWEEAILGHTDIQKNQRGQYVHPQAESGQSSIAKADQFFGVLVKSDTLRDIVGDSCDVAHFIKHYKFGGNDKQFLDWLDVIDPPAEPNWGFTSPVMPDDQESITTSVSRMTTPADVAKPAPVKVSKLSDPRVQKLERSPVMIEGLCREKEVVNVIAAPKTGKSWGVYGLAMALENATNFLGFNVPRKRRVLIVDNEIPENEVAWRLKKVAAHTGSVNQPDFIALRGRDWTFDNLQQGLHSVNAGDYDVLILDAYYRFLPKGTSENDNADATRNFNIMNTICKDLGVAIINIHHTSKGNQSEKAVTDVGAGAGAVARAADAHISIRPHAQDGYFVFEAVTRTCVAPDPISASLEWPVWERNDSIDATLKPADHRAAVRKEESEARRELKTREKRIEQVSKIIDTLKDNPVVAGSVITRISKSQEHTWAETELRRAKVIIETDYIMKGSKLTPMSQLSEEEQQKARDGNLKNSRGKAYDVKVGYRLADGYGEKLKAFNEKFLS